MSLQHTVRTGTLGTYIKGIDQFKKGYQPTTNLVMDESDDLLAYSHIILKRWKNYYSQLLNIHREHVGQTEIHITESLVLNPSPSEVEITIAKLKKYKLPGSDQIPAELIQGGVKTLQS
jgi:hypothetical protein